MNVIDSSAWLEYFANGPNANFFCAAIEDIKHLIVPSLTLYEVFKRVLQQTDENMALQAVASMHQGKVVDLDTTVAINAAKISLDHQLLMADNIILATARSYKAILWTQDADFKGLAGVKYRQKKRRIERNITPKTKK